MKILSSKYFILTFILVLLGLLGIIYKYYYDYEEDSDSEDEDSIDDNLYNGYDNYSSNLLEGLKSADDDPELQDVLILNRDVNPDTNMRGTTGERGAIGLRGQTGEIGPQGVEGPRGEIGIRGPRGIQGVPGNRGKRGKKGDQGVQGIQGIQGEEGEKGDRGERGKEGPQGPIGPVDERAHDLAVDNSQQITDLAAQTSSALATANAAMAKANKPPPPPRRRRRRRRGFCFKGETKIKLEDGVVKEMKEVEVGDKIKDGSVVYATMILKNKGEKGYLSEMYKLEKEGENNEDIIVSDSHIVDTEEGYVHVCEHEKSVKIEENYEKLYCLITNTHEIVIGNMKFGDWEDNGELPEEIKYIEKKMK